MAKRRIGLIPEPKDVAQLARIYKGIMRKIKDVLLSVTVDNYSALKEMTAKKKISTITHQLDRLAVAWSKKSTKTAYNDSRRITRTQVEILGFDEDVFIGDKIHTDAVRNAHLVTAEILLRANASIKPSIDAYLFTVKTAAEGIEQFQAFDMRDEAVIAELLDRGIREGYSRNKIKNLILAHFRQIIGEGNYLNINGRNYNLTAYAKMVARTRLRKVQTDAVLNVAKQFDSDLVEVSAHGTECASNICQQYEGNVYSLSGNTPGYPSLDEYPPFHPNCEHHMFPTSEAAIEYREK